LDGCRDCAARPRHRQDRRQYAAGAALLLGADLDASALGERRSDPLEPPPHKLAGLIEPDVGEVDRQERVLGGPIEGARELDVAVGSSVGVERIGDALTEEVERARNPLRGEPVRAGESVFEPRPGEVSAGQPVGAPLAAGERAYRLLPRRAGREGEQQASRSGRNRHAVNHGDGRLLPALRSPDDVAGGADYTRSMNSRGE